MSSYRATWRPTSASSSPRGFSVGHCRQPCDFSSLSGRACGFLRTMAQTKTLGTATQTRRQQAGPWGRPRGGGPTLYGKASPTRALWPPAATTASSRAPTQPRDSCYALTVVMPSAAVTFLPRVPMVASHVWLPGQQVEKAKPLIEPQTNLEPTRPSPRPGGSLPVSTVTATPLLQSPAVSPTAMQAGGLCCHRARGTAFLGRHG